MDSPLIRTLQDSRLLWSFAVKCMIVNLSPFLLFKSPHTWCLSTKHLHDTFGHVFLWRTAGTNILALPPSHSHTHLSCFFYSQWICYVLKYNSSFPSLSSWTNWKRKYSGITQTSISVFITSNAEFGILGLFCEQSQTFHYLWIKWPQHYLQISWWGRAFTGKHSMGETAFILRIDYFQKGKSSLFLSPNLSNSMTHSSLCMQRNEWIL